MGIKGGGGLEEKGKGEGGRKDESEEDKNT